MILCDCGKYFEPSSKGNGSIMCPSCVTNRRRFALKEKAIEYLGGKCIDCGYNKCIQALEFDHRNPEEKEFSISGKHCLSWDKIKNELDKCDLRCANCHRERHARETNIPKEYEIKSYITTTQCETCKKEFTHILSDNRVYCSNECSGKSRRKIDWPDIEVLTSLIKSSSFITVGQMLGVTDNAIRKHLAKNGVNPKDIRSIKNNGYMRL
jgi:hypothetical protein